MVVGVLHAVSRNEGMSSPKSNNSLVAFQQQARMPVVLSLLRRWRMLDTFITESYNEAKDNVNLAKFLGPMFVSLYKASWTPSPYPQLQHCRGRYAAPRDVLFKGLDLPAGSWGAPLTQEFSRHCNLT